MESLHPPGKRARAFECGAGLWYGSCFSQVMSSRDGIPSDPSNGTGGRRIPSRRAGAWYSEWTNTRGEIHSELLPGASRFHHHAGSGKAVDKIIRASRQARGGRPFEFQGISKNAIKRP